MFRNETTQSSEMVKKNLEYVYVLQTCSRSHVIGEREFASYLCYFSACNLLHYIDDLICLLNCIYWVVMICV